MTKGEFSKEVKDCEPLARYIFSDAHFSKQGRVKRGAFTPPKNKNTVSVMRYKDEPASLQEQEKNEIIKIGKCNAQQRQQSLKAIASVKTQDVRSVKGLEVQSDTSKGQHVRHAHIDFSSLEKAQQKLKADKLAAKAFLFAQF